VSLSPNEKWYRKSNYQISNKDEVLAGRLASDIFQGEIEYCEIRDKYTAI
jgi:hypothetical protein